MTTTPKYIPMGEGLEVAVDGDNLLIRANINAATGRPSGSGKSTVTASSGGFVPVPGGGGVKLNLSVGIPTAR